MIYKKFQIEAVAIKNDEPESDVPCGSCTECCRKLSPILTPDEFINGKYVYTLLSSPDPNTPLIGIPRTELGCFYFNGNFCTIYDNRPLACRQFDCRQNHYPPFKDLVKEKFNIDLE